MVVVFDADGGRENGDGWDAKIRRKILEWVFSVPLISANTQSRLEGYFRLEWKLAAQRTHTHADGTPFRLPVVIDATRDSEALVPEEVRSRQGTRRGAGGATAPCVPRGEEFAGGAGGEEDDAAPAADGGGAGHGDFRIGLIFRLGGAAFGGGEHIVDGDRLGLLVSRV